MDIFSSKRTWSGKASETSIILHTHGKLEQAKNTVQLLNETMYSCVYLIHGFHPPVLSLNSPSGSSSSTRLLANAAFSGLSLP